MIDAQVLEENLKSKTDFHLTSKSIGFTSVIDNIYLQSEMLTLLKTASESCLFSIISFSNF
jgi:hypothetical protein